MTHQLRAQNLQTAFAAFKSTRYVGRAFWFNVQDIAEDAPDGLWSGPVVSGHDARSPDPALRRPSFAAFQKHVAS